MEHMGVCIYICVYIYVCIYIIPCPNQPSISFGDSLVMLSEATPRQRTVSPSYSAQYAKAKGGPGVTGWGGKPLSSNKSYPLIVGNQNMFNDKSP